MGDSDEEFDRRGRGRDKFRRERSDYHGAGGGRRGGDDWGDNNDRSGGGGGWGGNRRAGGGASSGGSYREYELMQAHQRRRERAYSPLRGSGGNHDPSPPSKRARRGEWESESGATTQPPMMSFKQFLATQDDTIDDQDAVKKYNEYKLDFKKQQLNEFFNNHKDEEWFKVKYHPEESVKRKQEYTAGLKKRLEVFEKLRNEGWIDALSIDVEKSDRIVRLLDAVVILLEGGTDFDLQVLDEPPEEEKPKTEIETKTTAPVAESKVEENGDTEKGGEEKPKDKQDEETKEDGEENTQGDENKAENNVKPSTEEEEGKNKPKKKRKSGGSGDDDESGSLSSGEEGGVDDVSASEGEEVSDSEKKKKVPKEELRPPGDDGAVDGDETKVKEEEGEGKTDEEEKAAKEEKGEKMEEDGVEATDSKEKSGDETGKEGQEKTQEETKPRPRALHRTCSIFLRNLAPTITKQEVESMCRRYPGFLRVALAEPQQDRRFFRRGWVTFERNVNIKEICWNLNNIRLRDCELGAIVNRDLSRRIRSVNGIASHKQVVRADIKLAAKIIQNYDTQRGLWMPDVKPNELDMTFSRNPLLKNITDYLIEEMSAEEDELLGGGGEREGEGGEEGSGGAANANEPTTCTIERDEQLIKVLDSLLVYLRIVHSIDYYNHSDYSQEDEMPNRCGIMHARGSAPSSKVTANEINDYITHFETRIGHFLEPPQKLTVEEQERLGLKDTKAEVEKFMVANAQELAKDKWLCPLSGKKFKGPEFVRKHIINKHGEKIDEVKREVEYFNNYLADPKRPQLPEHPSNRPRQQSAVPGAGNPAGMMDPLAAVAMGYPHPPMPMPPFYARAPIASAAFAAAAAASRGGYMDPWRTGFKRFGGRGGHNDPRDMVGYHDLDAPPDLDMF